MYSTCTFSKKKPLFWVSKLGNKFSYYKYLNHGYGGFKNGYKDLPNEYPFTIEYDHICNCGSCKIDINNF